MSSSKAHGILQHAIDRINERTLLTRQNVSDILAAQAYVNMGSLPGIAKDHLLFYSTLDKDYFVLIRDSMNAEIITCLPLEYHKNTAWKVSEEHKAQARALVPKVDAAIHNLPPFVFVGVAFVKNGSDNWKNWQIDRLEHDYFETPEEIKSRLTNASIVKNAFKSGVLATDIKKVYVKVGDRGLPKYFDFPFDDESTFKYFEELKV